MDEHVLPCPWCGNALTGVTVNEGTTQQWRKVVGCCADGPEVRFVFPGASSSGSRAAAFLAAEQDARKRAIEAWNTRPYVEELMLCESWRLVLKKDKLYIFTVDPTCPKCVELDNRYGEKDG